MTDKYNTLNPRTLDAGVTYHRPPQRLPENVTLDHPATDVMTDFSKVAAITMGPCATLGAANQRMIATGVRLLFVTDQYNAIIGVVTTTDLQGERPMQYLQEVGGKREDIYLRDIMTPQDKLDVLEMQDVARSRVGDIVATLQRCGRQHALVVDRDGQGRQRVRGLFSSTQISKQLGTPIETTEVANSFAEVNAVLAS
ncbi:CBS domain-containing protein [Thiohalobacter sp. IOR34]|uniref:CBS domain-containing protein n=1 Tax=Thiohalobacter sp. IOR34 TaxID=3057176 RepID=UPI0025AFEBE5|nr:CBS domain-containing protein [Thiohalobacter sp. IOR34]WJW76638.1 CBS domain-containing protein [Thiohalobacter sp. IOR34]